MIIYGVKQTQCVNGEY